MFKDALKKARKNKNLRQEDVATLCNISFSGYKSYELGKTEPNLKNLIKIAKILEVSLDELCETEMYDEKDASMKIRLNKILSLNEKEKEAIDLVIKSIVMKHQYEETRESF